MTTGRPQEQSPVQGVGYAAKEKGRDSAREFAVQEIRAAIRTGELPAGEAIREDHWSSRLGVSRTPLREAIAELCVQGFLRKDGRSVYVFRPSLPELFEIYDIRVELEVLASRRAALRTAPDVLDKLGDLMDQVRIVKRTEGWFSSHELFHVMIAEASGMPRLANLVTSLREQSEPYVRIASGFDAKFRENAAVHHEEIYQCMLRGDARGIAGVTRRHLRATRKQVEKLMVATSDISRLVYK